MSFNELNKQMNDGYEFRTAETKTPEGHNGRIFMEVESLGYIAAPKDPNDPSSPVVSRQYAEGIILNPEYMNSHGQPHYARMFLKDAEMTARELSAKQGLSVNSGKYESNLAHTKQTYARRKNIFDLASEAQNGSHNVVMAFDHVSLQNVKTVKAENVESKVYEMAAHYSSVVNSSSKNLDDDRERDSQLVMGRLGFNAIHNNSAGRDTVYVEYLHDSKNFRLKKADDPDFKEQQEDVIRFIISALDDKEKPGDSAHSATAKRTGFFALKYGIHEKDEYGNPTVRDITESTTKFYSSREGLDDDTFDPVTGDFKNITNPTDPLTTLTEVVNLRDKRTLDYQKDPTHPEKKRRAMEVDLQRTFLHALSGRQSKEDMPLVIAVNDDENHLKIVNYFHKKAVDGDLEVTMTSGRKLDFFKNSRDSLAQKMRAVYDQRFPENSSKVNQVRMVKPHRSDYSMMPVEYTKDSVTGDKVATVPEIYSPMMISMATITDSSKTEALGSKLALSIKTAHPNGINHSPNFDLRNPKPELIQRYNVKHRIGLGAVGLSKSPAIERFRKEQPLSKTQKDAKAAYEARLNTKPTSIIDSRRTVGTLGDKSITNNQNLGIGLTELVKSVQQGDPSILASNKNLDEALMQEKQVTEDLGETASKLVDLFVNSPVGQNSQLDKSDINQVVKNETSQQAKPSFRKP